MHKTMGADEMNLQVLRKLSDEVAKSLFMIFEKSWQSDETTTDRKEENIIPIFRKREKEDLVNYRRVHLTLCLAVSQSESMLWHMENSMVINNSQLDFTKGKSYLPSLVAFYDGMTALVDKGRATDVISLNICRALGTVLHTILVSKLEKCGSEGWDAEWIRNWLGSQTQRVTVNSLMSK